MNVQEDRDGLQQYRAGLAACIARYTADPEFIKLFNQFTGYHFTPDCPQDSMDRHEFNLAVQVYRYLPELERRR